RNRYMFSRDVALSPTMVLMTTGKNAISAVSTTLGVMPKPNQMFMICAMATLGITWVAMSIGYSALPKNAEEAIIVPSRTPASVAAMNPIITSAMVASECVRY